MANIMSMVKLKNHTSRNAFDLSRRNAFTAKVGELLPVACIECIPGDKIKGRVQHFTRTMPVNTAAYTRIREYYDWFFVPTNLLWNKFNTFVTQMSDNVQHASSITAGNSLATMHPYFTVKQVVDYIYNNRTATNMFGFGRTQLTAKLMSYLGYGDYYWAVGTQSNYRENVNLNPFPLLAYQKIYADYFRDSQWEDAHSPSFNVDYLTNSPQIPVGSLDADIIVRRENMFDLRYANWNKDKFMGVLPNSQYGSASIVGISSSASSTSYNSNLYINQPNGTLTTGDNLKVGDVRSEFGANYTLAGSSVVQLSFTPAQLDSLRVSLGLRSSNFSVLALRQAEALQKWQEITQSQQQDYKNQIEAHFGVSMSDAYSERCRYVDGSVSNLDISEVTNTNITSDNAADIAGKGVGVGDSSVNFTTDVHGYLMCIYHAVPLLDYAVSGINKMNMKTVATDYAIPEFDATGMVQVPIVELTNNPNVSSALKLLGYAPRYYDYKTSVDVVNGGFRGTLSHWVAPITDEYIKNHLSDNGVTGGSVNYRFFKVNPGTLNPIFAMNADSGLSSDQLLINSSFDITAVRNLDRNGLPY